MADARMAVGGTGFENYVHCGCSPQGFNPPYGRQTRLNSRTPHFNAQYDGVYLPSVFLAGYPVRPADMDTQFCKMKAADPGVGDYLQLILIPTNHWVDFIRFDVVCDDPKLAGMTGTLGAQTVVYDPATKAFVIQETPEVATAATAAGVTTIALDKAYTSGIIPLTDLTTGKPLYAPPLLSPTTDAMGNSVTQWYENGGIMLGLKIASLPTDTNVRPYMMQNAFNLVAHLHRFDIPATLP